MKNGRITLAASIPQPASHSHALFDAVLVIIIGFAVLVVLWGIHWLLKDWMDGLRLRRELREENERMEKRTRAGPHQKTKP